MLCAHCFYRVRVISRRSGKQYCGQVLQGKHYVRIMMFVYLEEPGFSLHIRTAASDEKVNIGTTPWFVQLRKPVLSLATRESIVRKKLTQIEELAYSSIKLDQTEETKVELRLLENCSKLTVPMWLCRYKPLCWLFCGGVLLFLHLVSYCNNYRTLL